MPCNCKVWEVCKGLDEGGVELHTGVSNSGEECVFVCWGGVCVRVCKAHQFFQLILTLLLLPSPWGCSQL